MIKHTEKHKFHHYEGYKIKVGTGREEIEVEGRSLDVEIVEAADNNAINSEDQEFKPMEVILKISGNLKMSRTREEWFGWWEDVAREKQAFQQIKVLGEV